MQLAVLLVNTFQGCGSVIHSSKVCGIISLHPNSLHWCWPSDISRRCH